MVILHYSPTVGDIIVRGKKDETHLELSVRPTRGKAYLIEGELTGDTLSTLFGDIKLSSEDIINISNFYKTI